jgi:CubicO group peptidase (beta-lactamase class C family)
MTVPYAAGSLYSTVDDMLKWDQSFYGDKLLSAASRQAMFTASGAEGYGMGWGLDKGFGHDRASHSGGVNGFVTYIERFPAEKVTVIALSNVSNSQVGLISDDLAALALGIPARKAPAGEADVARHALEDLARGEPYYTKMGDVLAQATRTQLAGLKNMIGSLGAIKTVTLVRADANGMDTYRVEFEKGVLEYSIEIAPDGKAMNAGLRKVG